MKRFIKSFSVALVWSLFFTNAYSTVINGSQISLRRSYPIGGATRPSRCPAQTTSPVEVYFDFNSGIVTFIGNNDGEVSFIIYNAEGDIETSDSCNFNDNGEYSILLSPLSEGTYTIVVFVNEVEYFGIIEIEQ
ncbi:hypothetical protein [Prevotella sp. P3-122]|uniref:hypothetical protein n=1 Tax=Prevotella sp. P3-122 TaxID=2024223 RepID=UPI000B975E70|nr:hypothetical protein [Prevotella sp. P3-122]OYP60235.1 hypothetical protein CIL02_09455 [Prevotella sp. P3-122]